MGLFQKLFGLSPSPSKKNDGFFQTLTAYSPQFTSWSGYLYESALVRSSIDARARHISKLKIDIEGAAKPKLRTRFSQAPNEWQTWGQFLYRTSTILDMQNTTFIVPVFGAFGEVTGYFPVLPSRCEIIDYEGEPWLRYTFNNGQVASVELALCGIMTKFQYSDDFFGENNSALTDTMNLMTLHSQSIREAVKNSNTFRFMAQVNNFTKSDDLKKERERFNRENFQGEGGGLLLFPNTYQNVQQINANSFTTDAEQMKLIQTNVFNYFGVNEDILQNKSYGDAWQAFYEGAIEPFAIQFSDVMTKVIYTANERSNGNMIMLTANRLQYMSTTEKLDVSSQLSDRGILNRDDVRDIWNLPPIPNGEGQAYIIRGEYKNANDVNDDDGGDGDAD